MRNLLSFFILVITIIFPTNNSYSSPRNVLLEFSTGTWCQSCPCGDATAESILTTYPNTVVIAHHGINNDPFDFFHGWEIRVFLGYIAYPTGIIDRTNTPSNVTYNMWESRIANRYASYANADVNLVITNKYYNPTTRFLTSTITATPPATLSGIYMISFVFTEDNVIYPQTGNSSCPGGTNFNHKWIARSMINDAYGDTLSNGIWNANQTITRTISAKVDSNWVESNCKFIVFVYKDSSTLSLGNVMQAIKTNVTGPLGITNQNILPLNYELKQNYPNPFNPTTNIKFSVPKNGDASLKIYDIKGSLVTTYFNGYIKAGMYNVDFDGSNLSSGIYFYRLTVGDFSETKKMMLIK
ncbi:MAG: Omp28-related outer membrane protein [Ignavibacteria bacterium]|jgi:hypothetical protein